MPPTRPPHVPPSGRSTARCVTSSLCPVSVRRHSMSIPRSHTRMVLSRAPEISSGPTDTRQSMEPRWPRSTRASRSSRVSHTRICKYEYVGVEGMGGPG
eukprot:249891-Chlamydomonas_euryale.AAC.4